MYASPAVERDWNDGRFADDVGFRRTGECPTRILRLHLGSAETGRMLIHMELAAARVISQDTEISIDFCVPERGHAIGTYRNLLLLIWTEHMTLAEIKNAGGSMRKLGECYPSGIGCLTIVNEIHMMREEERRYVADLIKGTTTRQLRGVANVYRNAGFATAVLRGILTGLSVISRASIPLCVLPSVESAAAWLLPLLPDATKRPTMAGVVAAMSSLEAALLGQGP